MPKRTVLSKTTEEGKTVHRNRNLRRMRKTHRNSTNVTEVGTESDKLAKKASLTVNNSEMSKEELTYNAESTTEVENRSENNVFLPTQSPQISQTNTMDTVEKITKNNNTKDLYSEASEDIFTFVEEMIENVKEDSPIMSETAVESPVNYQALAKLAHATWLQDPFRVRRY
eukprot:TRINITY_DN60569_c0_g1_i1.p1 TRINITY_DN60569_c0_g1~~TRINITY_DN60569_c0_g1_i1.p1  ORF type:complete len:171 (+),score=51.34 TRINITY_DN60569_c0_g1_i1:207-719(+)